MRSKAISLLLSLVSDNKAKHLQGLNVMRSKAISLLLSLVSNNKARQLQGLNRCDAQ
jgi:hypothetical protein